MNYGRTIALCIFALIACTEETVAPDGPGAPGEPTTAISIAVAPAADTIGVGGTLQLSVGVTGSTNTAVTYRSSAATIATVEATGLVHGVAVGTATITGIAIADTTVRATSSITVQATAPPPKPPTVSIVVQPQTGTVAVGATLQLAAAVSGSSNTAVTYRSSAASIATVDADGLVHGVAAGSATITAVAAADTTKTATSAITVTAALPPPGDATYTAIALGDLGGGSATPVGVNDNGDVVGSSKATTSGPGMAFVWRGGVMTNLGSGVAQVMTNSGLVAGNFRSSSGYHIFTWSGGTRTDLGPVKHEDSDLAGVVAINAAADVVAWDAGSVTYYSAIWHGGVKQPLGGLPNSPESNSVVVDDAHAYAMNNTGQIVGGSAVGSWEGSSLTRGFVWENGTMRGLGLLSDPLCNDGQHHCGWAEALDVNNSGVIVGNGTGEADYSKGHALMWTNGAVQDLGPGAAWHVNEAGDVAGTGSPSGGFFWRTGSRVALPTFGGSDTHVADLGDDGTVVGSSLTASKKPHAFVWHPGDAALTDLGLGTVAGDDGAVAVAINARGDVVGYTATYTCNEFGCTLSGSTHAVLWKHK